MRDQWTRAALWAEHDARHRRRQHSLVTALLVGFSIMILGVEHYTLYQLMFLDAPFPTCVQPEQ